MIIIIIETIIIIKLRDLLNVSTLSWLSLASHRFLIDMETIRYTRTYVTKVKL